MKRLILRKTRTNKALPGSYLMFYIPVWKLRLSFFRLSLNAASVVTPEAAVTKTNLQMSKKCHP